jgi:hypothetical protein
MFVTLKQMPIKFGILEKTMSSCALFHGKTLKTRHETRRVFHSFNYSAYTAPFNYHFRSKYGTRVESDLHLYCDVPSKSSVNNSRR